MKIIELTDRDTEEFSVMKDKFWSNVIKGQENDCWPWTGGNDGKYGTFYINSRYVKCTRLLYFILHGKIPYGIRVLHKCDNPICVNPSHLFPGTQKDNILDSVNKGRWIRGGEGIGNAKLTKASVIQIRQRYKKGKHGCGMIALSRLFNVSPSTIRDVVKNKNWSYIEQPT